MKELLSSYCCSIEGQRLRAGMAVLLWTAGAARAPESVANLPQGAKTLIGERGATLSGGQRQRIELARALYRKPSLLILDEATSALDAANELEIARAIERVKKDCIVVLAAHRSSILDVADYTIDLGSRRLSTKSRSTHDALAEAS